MSEEIKSRIREDSFLMREIMYLTSDKNLACKIFDKLHSQETWNIQQIEEMICQKR